MREYCALHTDSFEPTNKVCTIDTPIGARRSARRKPRISTPVEHDDRVHRSTNGSRERGDAPCASIPSSFFHCSFSPPCSVRAAPTCKARSHKPAPGATRPSRFGIPSKSQAKRAALDAAIAQANQVLDEAQHPSDALTQIAHGISSWVPAPAQGPLVLGAALIATLTRSRQLKQSSMSIINSISHVLERDEQFKSLFEQHADTIRSIQTPTARKLVDQTNRKRAQAA